MNQRLTFDNYILSIVDVVASRATCPRRAVGCVIVDKNRHIKATGFNGVPKGFAHCIDHPCGGQNGTSGTGLDKCLATHAEQNALMQCSDINTIDTIYISTSPCIHCTKLIMNTSCKRLVCHTIYDKHPIVLLENAGIQIIHA